MDQPVLFQSVFVVLRDLKRSQTIMKWSWNGSRISIPLCWWWLWIIFLA